MAKVYTCPKGNRLRRIMWMASNHYRPPRSLPHNVDNYIEGAKEKAVELNKDESFKKALENYRDHRASCDECRVENT